MRNQTKDLVLVAPLGNPTRRPRLHKFIEILNDDGGVEFWGWARSKVDRVSGQTTVNQRNILYGGGFRNRFVYALYPVWVVMVFLNLIIFRPKKVIAMGLETSSACYLASFFFSFDYIYDDPDRFVLVVGMPKSVKRALTLFEAAISKKSRFHIIPSTSRYDYKSEKFLVLQNTPTRAQYEYVLGQERAKPSGFVVYVNGLLTKSRGLSSIARAASQLCNSNPEINFIVASKGHDLSAEQFFSLSNVNYLGELSPNEALSYYPISDVVLTLYDPCIEINRYAMPNKWGDALCFGTKIIVNKHTFTAKSIVELGLAEEVTYGDCDELVMLLTRLAEHAASKPRHSDHQIEWPPDFVFFDDASKTFLDRFMSD
jgi:glycosyltransferase involved in cell wall biosynthesis